MYYHSLKSYCTKKHHKHVIVSPSTKDILNQRLYDLKTMSGRKIVFYQRHKFPRKVFFPFSGAIELCTRNLFDFETAKDQIQLANLCFKSYKTDCLRERTHYQRLLSGGTTGVSLSLLMRLRGHRLAPHTHHRGVCVCYNALLLPVYPHQWVRVLMPETDGQLTHVAVCACVWF